MAWVPLWSLLSSPQHWTPLSSLHSELIQHYTLSSSYQWETLCCCYCMSTNGFGLDYNFISGIWVPTEELHNSHASDKCSLKLKNLKTVAAHITQSMVWNRRAKKWQLNEHIIHLIQSLFRTHTHSKYFKRTASIADSHHAGDTEYGLLFMILRVESMVFLYSNKTTGRHVEE